MTFYTTVDNISTGLLIKYEVKLDQISLSVIMDNKPHYSVLLSSNTSITSNLCSREITSFFTFMWPCILTNFFVIKPTRCTNFINLFCHETLHVSDSSSVHHQEFIHCTLSNGVSYRFVDSCRAVLSWSSSTAVYKPVWLIPLLSVQWINYWWWTEELSETCRVSWQNKFVKLVHLVGFITKKRNNFISES